MPLIETALRYQPTERYPFIHSDLVDRDRLNARKPPDNGITYEFNETQLGSGLFPGEEAKCKELLDVCDGYMPEDKEKIRLALQLSLYGHQRQFRKSGEPYTYHPLAVALEAAREYKADWQTVALCLLHDLAEDSGKYGHSVMPYFVAKAYKNIGLRNDGLILAEGMRALKKIDASESEVSTPEPLVNLFRRIMKKEAAIKSVEQLYATALPAGKGKIDIARVILVKLLDRKHNMETIKHIKPQNSWKKHTKLSTYM